MLEYVLGYAISEPEPEPEPESIINTLTGVSRLCRGVMVVG